MKIIKIRKKNYDSEYGSKNKKKIQKRMQNYYQENKVKIKQKNKIYTIEKYRTDTSFNIRCRLRHRLREALKRFSKNGKVKKSKDYGIDWQKIIDYLGPCPGDLKAYHIDHIIPLCKFDFNKTAEILKAFAPENHQWLLAEDNLRKNKY